MIFVNSMKKLLSMTRIVKYSYSGLPSQFIQFNNTKNTQIISLTGQQMQQLSKIDHYSTSIQYLKLNNLQQSLNYLQFSLNQARNQFPYSINLHGCIINRISILLKLLNKKQEFEKHLEQLYFISLSSKGSQNLDTVKNLINYLTCMTIYNHKKLNLVLEYLKQSDDTSVEDYLMFFDGLNDIWQKKQYQAGLKKLQTLPEQQSYQKIFKNNNLAYMRMYCMRQKYANPLQYLKNLKVESQSILEILLNTLLEAEKNSQQNNDEGQNIQQHYLEKEIQAYLRKQKRELPKEILSQKKILRNSNSHIITMNIASLLFQLERTDESFYFLQLSLQKAMKQSELQRIGMALILIGRCYYLKGSQKWQNIYIDILNHNDTYPKYIIKQALFTYSRLLFQQQRMLQAENYMSQSFKLQGQHGIQGLILPTYDFSY